MQINVSVTDANNIVCEVVPPQQQIVVIDRGVEGNGIVSIVPVTISTFQYLRITYTNGTVQDVGPLTSTAYTATAPITIVGNTISLATVPIASGGTDATTAAGAIQNLLPSYTGNANKRLGLNSLGTALEWVLDGGGTVTSVAASGGTTGLTFTGSPITTSGTLTLGGTLAVANGGTGVTSSTGTGSVVLSTSPTLVTPVLGTPTSGNFSTGTFTWPTFNQNTTGTAANITATSNSTLTTLSALSLPGSQVSGNISGNAANVTGIVAIANGGTGQITANAALNALLPTQTGNASKYLQTDGTNATWDAISLSTADITGILPTANGGTGLSSFTANGVVYASSTSALTTGSALTFDGTRLTSTTGKFGSGAASNSASLMVNNATNTATGIQLFQDGIESWIMGMPANSAGLAWSASGSEQMRLTVTGLGIGTSSVGYKLQVFSGSSGATSAFTSTNATAYSATSYNGATARILLQGGAASGAANGIEFTQGGSSEIFFGQVQESTGTGAFVWQGYDGSYYVERARLSGAGNFGVGTTTPAVKIHSQGQSSAATIELLRLSNIGAGANTASQLTFWAAGTNYADIIGGYGSSAPRLSFNVAGGGYQSWAIDGSDKLFLNTYGHFGVGTTSPVSNGGNSAGLVHISTSTVDGWAINHYTNGTTGFNSADGLIVGNIASDAYIFNYENANVIFGTNSGEKARITASGDFGIGTSSPAYKLDVVGGVVRSQNASGVNNGYLLTTNSLNANARNWAIVSNTNVFGDFAIRQGNSLGSDPISGTDRLVFNEFGNVGIGTSSPSYKLQVAGTTSQVAEFTSSDVATAIRINNTNAAGWGGNLAFYSNGTGAGFVGTIGSLLGSTAQDLTMWATSGNGVRFYTNGNNERMRVTSGGNVGIGTSSPNGTLQLSRNGSTGNFLVFDDIRSGYGDWVVYKVSLNDLTFGYDTTAGSAPTQAVTFAYGGNVGIGTSSPAAKLEVSIAAATSGEIARFSSPSYDSVYIAAGSSANSCGIGTLSTSQFNLFVNGSSKAVLSNSGQFGIGVSTPAATLDVRASGVVSQYLISTSGSVQENQIVSLFNGGGGYSSLNIDGSDLKFKISGSERARIDSSGNFLLGNSASNGVIGLRSAGTLYIGGGNANTNEIILQTGSSERARIDSSGQFMVRKSTAYALFDLGLTGTASIANSTITKVNDFASTASFGFGGLANNNDGVYFGMGAGGNNGIPAGIGFMREASGWNTALAFYTNNVTSGPNSTNAMQEKARIDSSGNLLVGTTSASAKLTVNATSQVYDWAVSLYNVEDSAGSNNYYFVDFRTTSSVQTGYIWSNGGTTTSYATSSDYRLKENIEPMTGALEKVAQLKPSTWSWKSNGQDGQGFIAHELQAVCPDAVSGEKDGLDKDGNPRYQAVDTSFLVATLTAAIQELKAEFDAYKASHP